MLSFAKLCRDQRTAARAEHEAERTRQHQKGHDEIDRFERFLAGVVGNEKSVHDAVDRGEDHHNDRGHDETEEFFIGKMVG